MALDRRSESCGKMKCVHMKYKALCVQFHSSHENVQKSNRRSGSYVKYLGQGVRVVRFYDVLVYFLSCYCHSATQRERNLGKAKALYVRRSSCSMLWLLSFITNPD